MTYTRNGIGYNSEDEANLAAEIPTLYLDRPFDAGHIAEAVIASDWLAAHDAETRRQALQDAADLATGCSVARSIRRQIRALAEKGADHG